MNSTSMIPINNLKLVCLKLLIQYTGISKVVERLDKNPF